MATTKYSGGSPNTQREQVEYAAFSSGAAQVEIVAAVANHRIVVLGFQITTTAALTPTFQSANTTIAAYDLAADSGMATPVSDQGRFRTAVGEALNIAAGAGTKGTLQYRRIAE